ncbi:nuclear transport factor 2 family protein [Actinoplanes sp. NPDC051494]|uniref:nuclear transport factor 2 family protein n=1 Tax=Actinoplanes sp. NPDC051494 TaxID=3363907 RepID=UPI0037B80287
MGVELPAPVRAFFDATNAEDRAGFLAAFAEDGVVDDWGREFQGHKAIGRWSDGENIGVHSRFEVTHASLQNGAYVVTATVSGGGFNGPSHFTFRVRDGVISRMTITE